MQRSIIRNQDENKWMGGTKSKNPIECEKMFNDLINGVDLYGGDIPPFMEKNITDKEWKEIKRETKKWNDHYISISSDTIRKLYLAKNCKYIQISDYGLYHLGEDPCGFGVPIFEPEQRLRIRIKPHSTRSDGTRSLSVTAACQPKNINKLQPSKYSLDDIHKLPPVLIYNP